jgi:hypothetical protein
MMRKLQLLSLVCAVLSASAFLPAFGQARPGKPEIDPRRVDEAIRKGVEFLKTAKSSDHSATGANSDDELLLLAFVHAGVPESDAKFQELFKRMMESPLKKTYKVALQAMVLEELDRLKYQGRIHQCAQFLVDNQGPRGLWSYGTPTTYVEPAGVATPVASKPKAREIASKGKERQKPPVVRKIPVTKQRDGAAGGDNSNSQYAALGLRACHDAGILLPRPVVELAKKWWVDTQLPDKEKDNGYGGVRGWSYKTGANAYGSMTAGAIGALCIYDYILGEDWKRDEAVLGGMGWLTKNFSVTENPGQTGEDDKFVLYYYLYAIERVGMLYVTSTIGKHDWYNEGAKAILDAQRPDGSWLVSHFWVDPNRANWDTAFAILFLKRATRPLNDVASFDRYYPPTKQGADAKELRR